ncbi:MAG: CoA-transferase, partial [Anaerolineae bacterium]
MSKIMPLNQAVGRFVYPGATLHFGAAWPFPNAALFEVIRRFAGRDPGFTLILSTGGATSAAPFLAAGLAKRIISSFLGDGYPNPGPNAAIRRVINSGQVTAENWTMLTLTLRLLAGAMGVPYLPTRSIIGSSLEDELGGQFQRTADPFNPSDILGQVPALHPDLNFTHGWAADAEGNTLLPVPLASNAFGALAAREGAIVTVEKIVAPEVIRAYSYMARIPASAVRAVCEVPFGAHPLGCLGLGLPDGGGYREDRQFILEARTASRTGDAQNDWTRRWILDLPDHSAYLDNLGRERIAHLQNLSRQPPRSPAPLLPPSPAEVMIAGAARVIETAVRQRGHNFILAGIGASHLAAWLAEARLRAAGIPVKLLAEVGTVGFQPKPGDPFLFALQNVPTAPLTTDILTVLGMMVPGKTAPCLGVLGAAQIDRRGNLNSTRLPNGDFLMGSGGANDVASTAAEVIVVMRQSRRRFVEQVAHVTSPGGRVTTVITQLGVYRKIAGELWLTGVFAPEAEVDEAIQSARETCGWALQVGREVKALPLPTIEDRRQIRAYDPYG